MGSRSDDADVTAWALAAGRGDRAALASFVTATQRDVVRFLTHLGSHGEAEDLAQETYLRALGSMHRFAGEASARTWLLSIARRVAADAIRRAKRRPRTADGAAWDVMAGAPGGRSGLVQEPSDGETALKMLITQLDLERREAFVLTQISGLSYAEAAVVCGCPIGTIRSRVARAREDLIAAMEVRPGNQSRGA